MFRQTGGGLLFGISTLAPLRATARSYTPASTFNAQYRYPTVAVPPLSIAVNIEMNIEMSVGGQKSTQVGANAHPCPPPLRGNIPVSEFQVPVLVVVPSTPSTRPPPLSTSNMHSIRNWVVIIVRTLIIVHFVHCTGELLVNSNTNHECFSACEQGA